MEITRDEIVHYYIDLNMSQSETARELGVGRDRIKSLVKKYEIKKSKEDAYARLSIKKKKELNIDMDELRDLYYNQFYSSYELAERYGSTREIIERFLRENGFSRSKDEVKECISRVRIRKGQKTDFYISEEDLKVLYITQNKSSNEIGDLFSVPGAVVRKFIRKYGIKKPKKDIVSARTALNFRRFGKYPGVEAITSKDVQQRAQEARMKSCMEKYGAKTPSASHLSEETRNILNNKDLFEKFLEENGKMSITQAAKKLGCSGFTIRKKAELLGIKDVVKRFIQREEFEVGYFLDSIGVAYEKNRTILAPLEIDFYCPDYKIGIEFNGTYWHSSVFKDKNYHFDKSKEAEKLGIRLIHIYEHEWDDERIRPIIESMLKIAFGKIDSRIYARNCEIREISNAEARPFNNANHLQGHRNAQVTYGLFYNGNLVQLMSFSKHKKYEWEIIRGCPGSNNIVIGGVSRLFKHFIKEHDPNQVFSYADFNKFDGSGYLNLGMEFIGYSGPDMSWIIDGYVVHRQPSKHKEFSASAEAKLWGAGSKKFLWTKK